MDSKTHKKNLLILFITLVIIMMGFGMVIPVIPFLVEAFGASGQELGMLMSIYALMQLIFSPIWGELSDRFGRRPVMLIGLFGNGLSMLFMGLANSIGVLFAARALAGLLASATLPTAYAYVSDSTTEENRGSGMGLIGAGLGVGMVLGPGFSGLLAEKSLSLPFFAGAVLSIFAIAVVFFFLPESLPKEARKNDTHIDIKGQFSEMYRGLAGPLGLLFILAFLISFGMTNFEGVFGLYMSKRFDYGPGKVGLILTLVGLVSAAVQGGLTGYATKRWGEEKVITFSFLGSAIGFVLMLAAFNLPTVLVTVSVFVFSNAMIRPGVSSLISKRAKMGQGVAMGLNNSFMSLGRVIGPLLAGTLLDINLHLPYLVGGLVTLVGFVLCIIWLKSTHQKTAPAVNPALSDSRMD
ncbi:MFS transporter [bacterium]|nr:MFS transporter [bacterium]MCB2179394.1 MFS transporter [bacterium]